MFGSAESEHPRLMVKLFRKNIPTYVITIHQRHRRPERQTTCDRNTALFTKVHRAVKTANNAFIVCISDRYKTAKITRSQAVARIADRTAKNCTGHVT